MRQGERARDGDGRHGARQRERRDDEHLASLCEIDDAVRHRDVQLQWRIGVDDGVDVGTRSKLLPRDPVGETDELEIVGHLAVPAREDERDLVGEHELRARHVQMPHRHRHVLRLGRATEHVDDFEALAQLHDVAEILERAGAATASGVHDIRRPRCGREGDAALAERHMPLRIHGMQRDVVRRACQRGGDECAVEAHDLRGFVHRRAGVAIAHACIGRQHLHPLRLENDERRLVNGGDLIVRKHPHRLEGIAQMAIGARAIEDGVARFGRSAAPSAPSLRLVGLFHAPIIGKTRERRLLGRRYFARAAISFFDTPAAPMHLSDMRDPLVADEGAAHRRRANDRFRQVIGSGAHLRASLDDRGIDVRIGSPRAARRTECERA